MRLFFAGLAAVYVTALSGAVNAQTLISAEDYTARAKGYAIQTYKPAGVPLLSWFDFFYVLDDHHLRQVFALPLTNNQLHASFSDDDANDVFDYSIGHYAEPGIPWLSHSGGCSQVSCADWIGPHPEGTEFVLIGFSAWFKDSDHHIREFAINEYDGYLVVWLNDKSYDRPIGFTVEYSWVPKRRIASMGHWGDGGYATVRAPAGTVPTGPVVLQGFDVSYISLDHHVSALAVSPTGVSLFDHNQDDAIRAQVNWVELAPVRSEVFEPLPPVFKP